MQSKKLLSSSNQKKWSPTSPKVSLPNMTLAASPSTKTNLLGFDKKAMAAFFVELGEKPYRAEQVLKWIHFNGVQDFQFMTNLSKDLRQKLSEIAEISTPEIIYEKA